MIICSKNNRLYAALAHCLGIIFHLKRFKPDAISNFVAEPYLQFHFNSALFCAIIEFELT